MDRNDPGDPAIRLCVNFGVEISRNERTGLQCDGDKARYVSREDLHRYWTRDKIDEILRVSGTIADSETVRRDYLQVLSTLVYLRAIYNIPALQCLNKLISHNNNDASLPWPAAPRGFKDEAHFHLFHKLQWRFCPVAIDRDRPMGNRLLDPCAIMPLSQLDSTTEPKFRVRSAHRRDSTLKAFKVNSEDVTRPALPSQDHTAIRNVVFKTFRNTLVFTDELEAYYAFQKNENIIDYYGSFHWFSESNDRHSTIILELAEEGSLLDLYKRNDPPITIEGILKFWMGFLGLIKGLLTLHNHSYKPGYSVIHQDMKPSNVLVSWNKPGSPTSLQLKIGDLGASTVKWGSEHERDVGPDTGAGKTYGAPELHLGHRISFQVGTYVDIWAIACIILEAAVWLSFGESARQSFREERMHETSMLSDEYRAIGCSDAFHDGEKPLKCVRRILETISSSGRRCDEITPEIVAYILDECLVEFEIRPTASQILNKLVKMLRRRSADAPVPPSSPSCNSPQRQSWQRISQVTDTSDDHMLSNSMNQSTQPKQRSPIRPTSYFQDPEDSQIRPASGPSTEPTLPAPAIRNSVPHLRSTTEPLPELHNAFSMHPSNGIASHLVPISAYPPRQSGQSSTVISVPARQKTSSTMKIKPTSRPRVSPSDLHEWIGYVKQKVNRVLPGWDSVKDNLEGRDFIIIVDNSMFMQQHRDELFRLVKDLSYLMKTIDPDGIEVVFTSNPSSKHKCTKAKSVEELLKASFGPKYHSLFCHMEQTMDTVVKDVKQRLQKPGGKQQSRHGPSFLSSAQKPSAVSIYVFTNGVWDRSEEGMCGVDKSIENLIAYMKEHGVPRTEASIQFVRFGSDERGKQRLTELDDDLPKKEANKYYDIVDHKVSTDSVWEILEGSILSSYRLEDSKPNQQNLVEIDAVSLKHSLSTVVDHVSTLEAESGLGSHEPVKGTVAQHRIEMRDAATQQDVQSRDSTTQYHVQMMDAATQYTRSDDGLDKESVIASVSEIDDPFEEEEFGIISHYQTLSEIIDDVLGLFQPFFPEPPVPPGMGRIRWTCRCGLPLFDDFFELEPGGLAKLQQRLRQQHDNPQGDRENYNSIRNGGRRLQTVIKSIFNPIKLGVKVILQMGRGKEPKLPVFDNNSGQSQRPSSQVPRHLLMCIDRGDTWTGLHQECVRAVFDDRGLFKFLRQRYFQSRSSITRVTLRSVKKLCLSRFEVDASNFARVHDHREVCPGATCVCIPPKEKVIDGVEYHCTPSPETQPACLPVIGSRELTHFFQHPNHVQEGQEWILNQLPKRTAGRLRASLDGKEVGWGLHFEEGWHLATIIVLMVCPPTLGGLIYGIVWSVIKGDIQGGFAIASTAVAVVPILLGVIGLQDRAR